MKIENKTFDEERALYNIKDAEVVSCTFAGERDGESVLKETRNVMVKDSKFSLRYPLWHADGFKLINSNMDDKSRAPIWYSKNGFIDECNINGIKMLRECSSIEVNNTKINSPEFGWKCYDIKLKNCDITSEYILLDSKNVSINNLKFTGKYSFQYIENMEISDSYLDTKDAFWHSKNVTVKNSVLKGEYLAWFSENLTLINCKIIGTQPLCYCKNLKMTACTMEEADLAFEYSEVDADISGNIVSVKNPLSGIIKADSIDDIIFKDAVYECNGKVIVKEN